MQPLAEVIKILGINNVLLSEDFNKRMIGCLNQI